MHNAFNKLDVNRDGVVTRLDAEAVYAALGRDYTNLTDALSVAITDETGSIKLLDLVSASLIDPDTPADTVITEADLVAVAQPLIAAGLLPFGDFDFDRDVDADDLARLESCATGPAVPQTAENCLVADSDHDLDIDQSDFGVFQRCLSGEGNAADPNCAN